MDAAAIMENAGSTCRVVRFTFGMGCELVTKAGAAFSTIAWKTPWGVSHERPQAPPDIHKKESFICNTEEGIDLVEAMENAHAGFDDR